MTCLTALVSVSKVSCQWTHLSCRRTQLWSRRAQPLCRRTQLWSRRTQLSGRRTQLSCQRTQFSCSKTQLWLQFPFGFASWRRMIQNFSVRRIKASFSEVGQFPFGFASGLKGDPNVSVRRIEASFRKRCNSLSGLQVGKKRRSKRFCAEDRGFLSEAGQFPFGKPLE